MSFGLLWFFGVLRFENMCVNVFFEKKIVFFLHMYICVLWKNAFSCALSKYFSGPSVQVS